MVKKKCCRKHFEYNPDCVMCELLNTKTMLPDKELSKEEQKSYFKDLYSI